MPYVPLSERVAKLTAQRTAEVAARRERRKAASIKRANKKYHKKHGWRFHAIERDAKQAAAVVAAGGEPNKCEVCNDPIGRRDKDEAMVCYRTRCWK